MTSRVIFWSTLSSSVRTTASVVTLSFKGAIDRKLDLETLMDLDIKIFQLVEHSHYLMYEVLLELCNFKFKISRVSLVMHLNFKGGSE